MLFQQYLKFIRFSRNQVIGSSFNYYFVPEFWPGMGFVHGIINLNN